MSGYNILFSIILITMTTIVVIGFIKLFFNKSNSRKDKNEFVEEKKDLAMDSSISEYKNYSNQSQFKLSDNIHLQILVLFSKIISRISSYSEYSFNKVVRFDDYRLNLCSDLHDLKSLIDVYRIVNNHNIVLDTLLLLYEKVEEILINEDAFCNPLKVSLIKSNLDVLIKHINDLYGSQ